MKINQFRLWDKENNKYFEPVYRAHEGQLEYITLTQNGRLNMVQLYCPIADESKFPDRFIIERFTGLPDKNGKEIYEGDTIRIYDDDDDEVGIVVWDNYESRWTIETGTIVFEMGSFYPSELEVIGNRHDNPELLHD